MVDRALLREISEGTCRSNERVRFGAVVGDGHRQNHVGSDGFGRGDPCLRHGYLRSGRDAHAEEQNQQRSRSHNRRGRSHPAFCAPILRTSGVDGIIFRKHASSFPTISVNQILPHFTSNNYHTEIDDIIPVSSLDQLFERIVAPDALSLGRASRPDTFSHLDQAVRATASRPTLWRPLHFAIRPSRLHSPARALSATKLFTQSTIRQVSRCVQ